MIKKTKLIENLVSMIVPVFNSEQYIEPCIRSLLNQSYKYLEIIIVDTHSIDKSGEICQKYCCIDDRIKYIYFEENYGQSTARNIGLDNVTGEFTTFVDSDDFLEQNAIELLIENYHQNFAELIVADFNKIYYNSSDKDNHYLLPSNQIFDKIDTLEYVINYLTKPIDSSLFVYSWGKLYKSSIIKNNNIRFIAGLHIYEDITFNYDYLKFVSKISYLKSKLYNYVIHRSSKSAGNNIFSQPLSIKYPLEKIREYLILNGISDNILSEKIGNVCIHFTIRTMVRFFIFKNNNISYVEIYHLLSILVNNVIIRKNLCYYKPSIGDSKIIPLLIKYKFICAIMIVCKFKVR